MTKTQSFYVFISILVGLMLLVSDNNYGIPCVIVGIFLAAFFSGKLT